MIEQHYARLLESTDADIAERLGRSRRNVDQVWTSADQESNQGTDTAR
jgi:hypothetical protein